MIGPIGSTFAKLTQKSQTFPLNPPALLPIT